MKETITIEKDYFEHLLACLANQKFINQVPNGDALVTDDFRSINAENQRIIDEAYRKGMELLVS